MKKLSEFIHTLLDFLLRPVQQISSEMEDDINLREGNATSNEREGESNVGARERNSADDSEPSQNKKGEHQSYQRRRTPKQERTISAEEEPDIIRIENMDFPEIMHYIKKLMNVSHHDLTLCGRVVSVIINWECNTAEASQLLQQIFIDFWKIPAEIKYPKEQDFDCIEMRKTIVLSNEYHTITEAIISNLIRRKLSKNDFFGILAQVLFTDLFDSHDAKAYFLYSGAMLFSEYRNVLLIFKEEDSSL